MNTTNQVVTESAPRPALQTFNLETYELPSTARILTPALLVYRDLVSRNIDITLRLLQGNARRWRPHVKTAKLDYVIKMLIAAGVTALKCATSLELLTAIHAGAKDVLVAYPLVGTNALRVREIAAKFPEVAISVLVDNPAQIEAWRGASIGIFVDINPGMNRTGVEQEHTAEIAELVQQIGRAGLEFHGLHYYDGHLNLPNLFERTRLAHAGYDHLLSIVETLRAEGISTREVITAGTPAFPCSISYAGFQSPNFLHSVSPGTLVYCDATSMRQLPGYGYTPAVLVLSQVVSRPADQLVTCDAGHKTVSVDSGVPNCVIVGKEEFEPLRPSEEHLPIHVPPNLRCPDTGDFLYLIPRHVCPTVNNFDRALIIAGVEVAGVEKVDARGREGPLLSPR